MDDNHEHEHDKGLEHDLGVLWDRRRMLGIAAGVGAAGLLAACGSDSASGSPATGAGSGSTSASASSTGGTKTATTTCVDEIPEETAGPYPGDGSNGPDVLTESGIVRRDIRSSFGTASGVAEGIPLTIVMKLQDASTCKPLAGRAIYLWHCNRAGEYSMYTGSAAEENYLRGVQVTNRRGIVRYTTIFPACYDGRWPHAHFEVYKSLREATRSGQILATSQMAFPEKTCKKVYATEGYEASVANLARTSLDTDMVFSDDHAVHQMASVTGNLSRGFKAKLTVGV